MRTVQITNLIFDIPVNSVEDIKAFRKPVSNLIKQWRSDFDNAGIPVDYFHNHNEETGNTINRYPLIQYHAINGRLVITGINEGSEALEIFSGLLAEREIPGDVHFKGKSNLPWKTHQLKQDEFDIRLTDTLSEYLITNWLPLEDERYELWSEMLSLQDRITLLDEALPRQIAKFLGAAGINYSASFTAFVSNVLSTENKIKEYNFHKLPFTCTFRCNVLLPDGIGIGQVPSIGFGRINKL